MGNSSSKGERRSSRDNNGSRQAGGQAASGTASPPAQQTPADRSAAHQLYGLRNGSGRGSRHDLSFLNLGRDRNEEPPAERPRETKQERDARRAEKERQARAKERERSIKEEGVDGGYLVTLGTYTGPEDFNKPIVRQLQIERRLAPFWKGLNDHSDSWTEAQLVAAVRGLPIPAADEIPADTAHTVSQASASDTNLNHLAVPIMSRCQSSQSDASANLSASHPAFSSSGLASQPNPTPSSAALLRGRAKTLASLATGSRNQSDPTPQEIRLPKDPSVNGLPLEAYLYREPCECPICFMYYPPYLNKTRCCDQPICSECFVQIKRPDPHPPEHEQPGQPRPPEEEAEMLVSEVAACPFCVTPEFGVAYDPPPFRRGLAYANQANGHPLRTLNSAMSSSSSLASGGGRRRATSLSASSPQVITTDKVRPDWAKKLADARAHALRRSAAATALHNAAYVLGNPGESQVRGGLSFGRRRRTLLIDSPSASGSGTPRAPEDGAGDGRSSSRQNRVDDLEDLMMMEAIRLSLAAEDDRKRKEEKEARKEGKKRAKEEKKQAKQAEKLAKKRGDGNASLYPVGTNDSTSTWASGSMARSTSNLGMAPAIPEEEITGKGKAPVQDFAGFIPLSEPTSTLNMGTRASPSADDDHSRVQTPDSAVENAQRHLEASRAHLQPVASSPIPTPSPRSQHFPHRSNASSAASSFVDSTSGSLQAESNLLSGSGSGFDATTAQPETGSLRSGTPPTGGGGAPGLESMFNFRSLATMVNEDKAEKSEHIEDGDHGTTSNSAEEHSRVSSQQQQQQQQQQYGLEAINRSRGDSGESSSSSAPPPPPIYVEHSDGGGGGGGLADDGDGDRIMPVSTRPPRLLDRKDVDVLGNGHGEGEGDVRAGAQRA